MGHNWKLIIFGVIGIVISITMFTVAVGQLDTAMTATYPITEEEFVGVDTTGGLTTANVTLANALWSDDVDNVILISSNVTGETPAASIYYPTGYELTVTSLAENVTHTLTVTYYDSVPIFTSVYDIMGVYGLVFWVAITGSGLAMLGFGVWGTVKGRASGSSRRKIRRLR